VRKLAEEWSHGAQIFEKLLRKFPWNLISGFLSKFVRIYGEFSVIFAKNSIKHPFSMGL
jgi:hypothetical protein